MIKSALLAAVLGLAFVAPAYAQSDFVCDEASMTKVKTDIDAMTDKEKQTTSVQEWEQALAEMKGSKLDDCQKRIRQLQEKNKASGG
jgi:uncharacterized protein YmfQ (DUF2313 family)